MSDRRYLSIGEVLGLLLEEFPDVTISKIRFLESQGLIDPERTPSGYRKFYDLDVERLRVILREQRENFLPLKVIKDRLDSGELSGEGDDTPTGSIRLPRPRGAAWFDTRGDHDSRETLLDVTPSGRALAPVPAADAPSPVTPITATVTPITAAASVTPASLPAPPRPPVPAFQPPVAVTRAEETPDETAGSRSSRRSLAVVPEGSLTDDEVCALAGVEPAFLIELESYGLVTSRQLGNLKTFDGDAVRAVVAAAGLRSRGLEPRHLRVWRTTVDKEVGLIEQLVTPLMRQRNPKAREQAMEMARDIEALGGELRAALARTALRHLIG